MDITFPANRHLIIPRSVQGLLHSTAQGREIPLASFSLQNMTSLSRCHFVCIQSNQHKFMACIRPRSQSELQLWLGLLELQLLSQLSCWTLTWLHLTGHQLLLECTVVPATKDPLVKDQHVLCDCPFSAPSSIFCTFCTKISDSTPRRDHPVTAEGSVFLRKDHCIGL